MPQVARQVIVSGRVQGVFFRDSTRRQAMRFDVSGWIRNERDGTVTAWLEGEPVAVDELTDWIRAGGPPDAEVHDVRVNEEEPAGHRGFSVRG